MCRLALGIEALISLGLSLDLGPLTLRDSLVLFWSPVIGNVRAEPC